MEADWAAYVQPKERIQVNEVIQGANRCVA
jgi:hypothetical protein